MVGFLLGGKLTAGALSKSASQILWISISAAIVTTIIVSTGLVWIGVSAEIAILLGCIAAATAPASVTDSSSSSPAVQIEIICTGCMPRSLYIWLETIPPLG